MPLVRISLRRGKPPAYRRLLGEGVYEAMRETFGVPEEDRFVVIHQHDEDDILFSPCYFDIARDQDFVIIQITANNTRTVEQKKALVKAIAARLELNPGLKPSNVFVNIVEVAKENWSFGNGIAQYA